MMHASRLPCLLLVLALGCGAKDETTDGTDSEPGTTAAASTTGTTAAATTGDGTTAEPTTAASTGTSTGDGTTAAAPPCETSPDDCDVQVSDVGSFCPDTPPAKDELVLEALGPGKLRITEVGRDSACNITIGTKVTFAPNRLIIVTYEIMGTPDDSCTCKHEVTTTLDGLAPGTWEVLVGSWSGMVDVP